MFHKLKKEYQSNVMAPYINLVSCGFMIGIFVNMLIRAEYSLLP